MNKYKVTITLEKIIEDRNINLIENLLEYRDVITSEFKSLVLSVAQKNVLSGIEENKNLIIRKDRQVGVSTVINAIIACELIKETPINIIFFTPESSFHAYNKEIIKINIDKLIKKLNLDLSFVKNNREKIVLSNGNEISFKSVNQDVSYSLCSVELNENSWVIFDEIAYSNNDHAKKTYDYISHYGSKDIKKTIISTQNGFDDLFFPIYLLGSKSGYKKIDVSYCDAHEGTIKKVKEMYKYISDQEMARCFLGTFIVNNKDLQNPNTITNLVEPYLLPGEKFSLQDLITFIQTTPIKII